MNETCQQSSAVPDDEALKQQLKSIGQTLIVLSGKGRGRKKHRSGKPLP